MNRFATIASALVVSVLLLGSASGDAQSVRPTPVSPRQFGGGTSPISPVVVAQWLTIRKGNVEQLELLVLWRGTPGWFLQPGGSGGSGGATNPSSNWIKRGDVTLSLDFDEVTRVAAVQGRAVTLNDNNVLFVDDVDGPAGPRVEGMISVVRAMPGSFGQIAPILRSSPRIMSFLRCDAGSDSPQRAQLQPLCMQNVGAER
jgi:hypothetical protein